MKIDRELLKGTTEIVVLATIAQEPVKSQGPSRGGRDLKTVLASRLTPILSTEFGGSKIEVYSVDAMFTNATESNRRRSAA